MLIIQIWFNLDDMFHDPGISQIEKILVKFCPKFLDLYASIYGTLQQNIKQIKLKPTCKTKLI